MQHFKSFGFWLESESTAVKNESEFTTANSNNCFLLYQLMNGFDMRVNMEVKNEFNMEEAHCTGDCPCPFS